MYLMLASGILCSGWAELYGIQAIGVTTACSKLDSWQTLQYM